MEINYNKKLLKELCERDNSKIDYDEIKNYNCRIMIEFICNCGKCDKKSFRSIYNTGIFCKACMKIRTQNKIKATCVEKYGVENPFQDLKIKEKIKEKYGVEHISQSQDFKDKMKEVYLEKYGETSFFKTESVKDKIKATCLEKYGVEYASQSEEVKEKITNTNLEKYGVNSYLLTEEFKEKHKQTCLKKYGTVYPMQNAEVAEKQTKSFFKKKLYVFPTGEEINIQGYENYLLDILINEGYTFKDILTKRTDVPEVWYSNDNNKHRYYCDIYIPKINKVYEVKSIWTNGRNIDTNKLKKEACLKAGFVYELFVFNKKGIRQTNI